MLQQVHAQTFHYLYLETESGKPFYVRMQQKTFSSSASGYLLIPRLRAGKQVMTIGFPGDARPKEYAIMLQQDAGYMLRKTSSGAWSLTDLSDPLKIIPVPDSTTTSTSSSTQGSFSDLLSQVVSDPELANEKKSSSASGVKTGDSTMLTLEPEASIDKKSAKPVLVQTISRQAGPTGWNALYIVQNGDKGDTVSVLIEAPSEMAIEAQTARTQKDSSITTAQTKVDAPVKPNTCKSVAGMPEFLRLRKLMAAQQREEAMTEQARKFIRNTCISTDQAKRLSDLYLTEKERYAFFDLVYPNITDPDRFPELEKQLTDTYYINRFRAMLR